MAYNAKNLSVLAYANGFTLWHYRTPDAGYELADTGYFNGAAEMLRAGDMIHVVAYGWSGIVATLINDGRNVAIDILTRQPGEPKQLRRSAAE